MEITNGKGRETQEVACRLAVLDNQDKSDGQRLQESD